MAIKNISRDARAMVKINGLLASVGLSGLVISLQSKKTGATNMNAPLDLKPLMTVDYVASILGVETDTMKNYVRQRKFRCAIVGAVWLFTEAQLLEDVARLADEAAHLPKPAGVLVQVQNEPVPRRRGGRPSQPRPDLSKFMR